MQDVYILSEDLEHLLKNWAVDRFGRQLTTNFQPFRERLRRILAFGDHHVLTMSFEEILEGMQHLLEGCSLPVVSLNPVYTPTEHMIHVTRACDHAWQPIPRLFPRHGRPPPQEQFARIAQAFGASVDHPIDIAIIDDVVYSGNTIVELHGYALEHGLRIRDVLCGIQIKHDSSDETLGQLGMRVVSAFRFPHKEDVRVIDEICERDFFVIAPMMGRTLADSTQNAGFPYMHPFGHAAKWASFPEEKLGHISQALIRLNIDLIETLEQELGPICFHHLTRHPVGVRHHRGTDERLVSHLVHHLDS